jgi:hypothetical protein
MFTVGHEVVQGSKCVRGSQEQNKTAKPHSQNTLRTDISQPCTSRHK